jgi:hypothetical protein
MTSAGPCTAPTLADAKIEWFSANWPHSLKYVSFERVFENTHVPLMISLFCLLEIIHVLLWWRYSIHY